MGVGELGPLVDPKRVVTFSTGSAQERSPETLSVRHLERYFTLVAAFSCPKVRSLSGPLTTSDTSGV